MRNIRRLLFSVAVAVACAAYGDAAQTSTASTISDADRDALADDLEQSLLEKFRPTFILSAGECDRLPATFLPAAKDPVAGAQNGTIYGQAFRRPTPRFAGDSVELHYYHLWGRDCGRRGHRLDAEHVSVIVNAPSSVESPLADWIAKAWYAAAHENTVCDVSR